MRPHHPVTIRNMSFKEREHYGYSNPTELLEDIKQEAYSRGRRDAEDAREDALQAEYDTGYAEGFIAGCEAEAEEDHH